MPTDEQVKFYSQFLDHATQAAISAIREHAVECEAEVEVTTAMEPRIIAELFVVYDAISNLQKGAQIVDAAAERIFALVTQGRERLKRMPVFF
jgi:hypothetical protein